MIVMKFGGSSVAGAEKIRRVAGIVKSRLDRRPLVVASAFRGVTDDLLALAKDALRADKTRLKALKDTHAAAAADLGVSDEPLRPLYEELNAVVEGVALLRELTPRTLDKIAGFGERLSTRLIAAAFSKNGLPARQFDASDAGLITDERFGGAAPLPEADVELKKSLSGLAEVAVVTGYIGRTKTGEATTLGRNGSDFSATIIGAALGAEEIQIWSDTDGIMTADPRLVASAQPIEVLSFDEACELAYYGGKVLHPHTLVPAMRRNIPVRVLNTFKPEHPGTLIVPQAKKGPSVIKSIAFKRHQAIVSVSSPRMLAGPGFLARIFASFAKHEVDVDMIATSEVSVSATTGSERNIDQLLADLSGEFETGVQKNKAVICVVGDGIQSTPGVAGEVFSALKEAAVNVLMISQGASKNNIAFVVENDAVPKAVEALHRRFFRA
jgi:aspartate kinase